MAKAPPTLEELLEKHESGVRLSNKERRLLDELKRKAMIQEEEAERDADPLSAFSLVLTDSSAKAKEGEEVQTLSSTDVIVNNFSISAPKMDLFVSADLKLVQNRKYGLLGPNGKGKTTLLKFLEARKLPVPKGLDVLLVEQEKAADDTPIVDQVLESHTVRSTLLEEEQQIMVDMEKQYKLIDGDGDKAIDEDDLDVEEDAVYAEWNIEDWIQKNKRLDEIIVDLQSIGSDSADAKVKQILSGLGFSDVMMKYGTTKLSGGWRMRVALACALFIEPKLLLLDEPTNHLDLNATLWLERYLSKQSKSTILSVSHDQDFLDVVCTDLMHLEDQKLKYYGAGLEKFLGAQDINFNRREEEYAIQQKFLTQLKSKGNMNAQAAMEATKKKFGGSMLARPNKYNVKFNFLSPEQKNFRINVQDVDFTYPGTKRSIFTNVNFGLTCGDRVAIVGDNGSGKTTLLNLITKKLQPTEGEVDVSHGCRIARYDQHFDEHLELDLSGVDFLRKKFNLPEEKARASLGQFGLEGSKHLIPMASLSGGQKARVVLASLALQRPHILLMDEPTNHLDLESVEALIKGVTAFEGGVILVSHDARLIEDTNCRIITVPGDGRVIEYKGEFSDYRKEIYDKIDEEERLLEEKIALLAAERAKEREAKKKQYEKYIRSQKEEKAKETKKKELKKRVRVEKRRG